MARVGHGIPVYWKKAIVPKSPMEQPIKHHMVLYDDRRHVCQQNQFMLIVFLGDDADIWIWQTFWADYDIVYYNRISL